MWVSPLRLNWQVKFSIKHSKTEKRRGVVRPLKNHVTLTLLKGRINCIRVSFTCLFNIFWKTSNEVHHKHFSNLCSFFQHSRCCYTILFVTLGTQSIYTCLHQSVHIWTLWVPTQNIWHVKCTWASMSARNFLLSLRNYSIFICILACCIWEANLQNLAKFLYFGYILKYGVTSTVF